MFPILVFESRALLSNCIHQFTPIITLCPLLSGSFVFDKKKPVYSETKCAGCCAVRWEILMRPKDTLPAGIIRSRRRFACKIISKKNSWISGAMQGHVHGISKRLQTALFYGHDSGRSGLRGRKGRRHSISDPQVRNGHFFTLVPKGRALTCG